MTASRDFFAQHGRMSDPGRYEHAFPDHFGIFDMHGLWFVRGNLVRDVAALNRVELLPWDCWGLINGEDAALTADDWALLDRLAALTRGDVAEFEAVRDLYEREPRLRVGNEIRSYVDGQPLTVRLAP